MVLLNEKFTEDRWIYVYYTNSIDITDMALMVSKIITDLGFKLEKEICSDCKKRKAERSEEHEAMVKAQAALDKARKK